MQKNNNQLKIFRSRFFCVSNNDLETKRFSARVDVTKITSISKKKSTLDFTRKLTSNFDVFFGILGGPKRASKTNQKWRYMLRESSPRGCTADTTSLTS